MQISNIWYRIHVGYEGYIDREDIIYDRKNADGSIDRVTRACRRYLHHERYKDEERYGLSIRSVIEKPQINEINELQQFAINCEKAPQGELTRIGLLISTINLSSKPKPLPVSKPVSQPVQKPVPQPPLLLKPTQNLQGQVEALRAKVGELTQKLAAVTAAKEAKKKELGNIKAKLQEVENLLRENMIVHQQSKK